MCLENKKLVQALPNVLLGIKSLSVKNHFSIVIDLVFGLLKRNNVATSQNTGKYPIRTAGNKKRIPPNEENLRVFRGKIKHTNMCIIGVPER